MSEENKTAEELAAEKKAAGKVPGFERKKEYTVKVDILNSGKLIKAGTRGALKQLSDTVIAEFIQAKVIA